MGRNKSPVQGLGFSPSKKTKGLGATHNTTYTVLVQDPKDIEAKSIPQVETVLQMNDQNQASLFQMQPETAPGSAGQFVSEDTLIARSDFENTLNKILNQTKDIHGKQNIDLKVPPSQYSPSRAQAQQQKVKDEELIESYNRYSL